MDGGGGGGLVAGGNTPIGGDEIVNEMVYLDEHKVRGISLGGVFGCKGVVEGRPESKSSPGHGIECRESSGKAIRCSSLEVLVEWLTASK